MCFYTIVLCVRDPWWFGECGVKEKLKYISPAIPLDVDFVDTLHHIVICHQTRKQFEKSNIVNN